jgi:hypothetical protein
MTRARTLHTVAASSPGATTVEVALASHAPVGDLIAALGDGLGWPPEGLRLATPNLAVFGRPDIMAELGFERRTQDQRRHTVAEVLPGAGSTARLTVGPLTADVVVTTVAVTVDPSECGATPSDAVPPSGAVQHSGEDGEVTERQGP